MSDRIEAPMFGLFARTLLATVFLHIAVATACGVMLFSVVDFVEVGALAADTATTADLLQLSLMKSPTLIRLILPVAAPIGVTTAVGSLVRRFEIGALFAAGASPRAVFKPIGLAALAVACVHWANVEWLVPPTRARVSEVRARMGLHNAPVDLLGRNRSWFKGREQLYRVRSVLDTKGEKLGDVLVLAVERGRLKSRWDVGRLEYDGERWTGHQVVRRGIGARSGDGLETMRLDQRHIPLTESPEDFMLGIAPPERLPYLELASTTEARERLGLPAEKHRVELYRRHSVPLVIWLTMFVAVAVALRLGRRQSFAWALFMGTVVGFASWVLRETERLAGNTGTLPPWLAAHLTLVFFLIGAAIALRMAHRWGIGEGAARRLSF
jgi:lipopolysaccharide export system permease protein